MILILNCFRLSQIVFEGCSHFHLTFVSHYLYIPLFSSSQDKSPLAGSSWESIWFSKSSPLFSSLLRFAARILLILHLSLLSGCSLWLACHLDFPFSSAFWCSPHATVWSRSECQLRSQVIFSALTVCIFSFSYCLMSFHTELLGILIIAFCSRTKHHFSPLHSFLLSFCFSCCVCFWLGFYFAQFAYVFLAVATNKSKLITDK